MTAGDPFKLARAGSPLDIPALAWNAMIVAAKAEAGRRANRKRGAPPRPLVWDTFVRNDTGGDLDRFSIVALGSPVTTPTARLAGFVERGSVSGSVAAAADRGRFAILQEPIREDAIGRALAVGVTVVKIEIPSPTSAGADHADIKPGSSSLLLAGPSGAARILWLQPEADREVGAENEAWAIVQLGKGGDPGAVFRVLVYKDGGSAGSVVTTCSWTYTVKDLRGRTLALEKVPKRRRLPNTVYTLTPDGTEGDAYYDTNGILQLADANETPEVEDPCPESVLDGGDAESTDTEGIDGGDAGSSETETIDGGDL